MQGTHVGFLENTEDYKCNYCDELFANYPLLDKHMQRNGDNYSCKGKSHSCNHCDKKFGNRTLLKNHLRLTKTTLMCDDCGKVCHTPSELAMHKRSHTGNSYYCLILKKIYSFIEN